MTPLWIGASLMNNPKIKKLDTMVINPLNSSKWANKKCLCGSDRKLKNCHGVSEQIPESMWGLAKSWELHLEGKRTVEEHNIYVAKDNLKRITDFRDRKWLKNFFIVVSLVFVAILIGVVYGYCTGFFNSSL